MITLEEAKAHLVVEHDEHDTQIEGFILAATDLVERYTGRTIVETEKTQILDCLPSSDSPITLECLPISAVTAFAYFDSDEAAQTIAPSALTLDTRRLRAKLSPVWNTTWPDTSQRPQCVTITCTAGYAADQVPEGLKLAAKRLIASMYEQKADISERTLKEVPNSAKWAMNRYQVQNIA